MNHPVNIMILCNNEMALPALHQLYVTGSLKVVAVPEENTSLTSLLNQLLTGTGVTLIQVNKKNLLSLIKFTIVENHITTAWMMTFAYILPKKVLDLLPNNFINFHYGILPKYRGPNPILAQMLNYETKSGITIHIVDEKIDAGPIIYQETIEIEDRDTYGIQLKKLGILGTSMAVKLLWSIRSNQVLPSLEQDKSQASYYKKPIISDLMINWKNMSSWQIIRLINSCNPWNKGAGTYINNMGICITDAEIIDENISEALTPGTIVSLDTLNGLIIYCCDQKLIKVNVINLEEGFFAAKRLLEFGIKVNDRFISP